MFQKSMFLSIPFMLLTGCMPKVNGQYQSQYSYHPYNDLYQNRIVTSQPKKIKLISAKKTPPKTIITPVKIEKVKSRVSFNDHYKYPSILPVK